MPQLFLAYLSAMQASPSLFLVGPMGAGKTSIGRALAKRLKMDFVDIDREIERRTGVTIPTIFDVEGESGFRRREREALDVLTQLPGTILATGGGVVINPANRGQLAARGWVVYLYCPVDVQLERTARSHNRPLLQTDDPRARLDSLMKIRDPLYREVANCIVDTQNRPIAALVQEIANQFQKVGVDKNAPRSST